MARRLDRTTRNTIITVAGTILVALIYVTYQYGPFPGKRTTSPPPGPGPGAPAATLRFEGFQLDTRYVPSGWMGDGEKGTRHVTFDPIGVEIEGRSVTATRIRYSAGPSGWAGVYWVHPDATMGTQPGLDLSGATEIVFLARGEEGGEVVEFKAGGVHGAYSDSFERSLGKVALTREWKQYRIGLEGADLTNVIGGFAWSAPARSGTPIVFYLSGLEIH